MNGGPIATRRRIAPTPFGAAVPSLERGAPEHPRGVHEPAVICHNVEQRLDRSCGGPRGRELDHPCSAPTGAPGLGKTVTMPRRARRDNPAIGRVRNRGTRRKIGESIATVYVSRVPPSGSASSSARSPQARATRGRRSSARNAIRRFRPRCGTPRRSLPASAAGPSCEHRETGAEDRSSGRDRRSASMRRDGHR